jgi:hypothetical protein
MSELLLHLLVIHAYTNEIHGSRIKIPSKNLVRQRCTKGFNSGVKRLILVPDEGFIKTDEACSTF